MMVHFCAVQQKPKLNKLLNSSWCSDPSRSPCDAARAVAVASVSAAAAAVAAVAATAWVAAASAVTAVAAATPARRPQATRAKLRM